ncbi:unnamed protein product, partial [Rotaria sp. Silwood1]
MTTIQDGNKIETAKKSSWGS